MLFRNNAFSYGVLVKERRNTPLENTEKCVEFFKGIMEGEREQDWFLAVGQPVERLSSIKSSYYTASKTFARRYLYDGSVLYYKDLKQEDTKRDNSPFLKKIDINALNPATLERFLGSGLLDETEDFVRDYFQAIGHEAMESLVFRNYVILNVRFSVLGFLQKLGCEPGRLEGQDTEQELMERAKQEFCTESVRNAGRPKALASIGSIAHEMGIPKQSLYDAKQHVKAVAEFPPLADLPKYQAMETAKELRKAPPEDQGKIIDLAQRRVQTTKAQTADEYSAYIDECWKMTKKYHKAINAFMWIQADEKELRMLSEIIHADTAPGHLREVEDSIAKLSRIRNFLKGVVEHDQSKKAGT